MVEYVKEFHTSKKNYIMLTENTFNICFEEVKKNHFINSRIKFKISTRQIFSNSLQLFHLRKSRKVNINFLLPLLK